MLGPSLPPKHLFGLNVGEDRERVFQLAAFAFFQNAGLARFVPADVTLAVKELL